MYSAEGQIQPKGVKETASFQARFTRLVPDNLNNFILNHLIDSLR